MWVFKNKQIDDGDVLRNSTIEEYGAMKEATRKRAVIETTLKDMGWYSRSSLSLFNALEDDADYLKLICEVILSRLENGDSE